MRGVVRQRARRPLTAWGCRDNGVSFGLQRHDGAARVPHLPALSTLATDSTADTAPVMSFDQLRQTYLEAWPYELRKVSVPSSGERLTLREVELLGRSQLEWWETWTQDETEAMPDLAPVQAKLERLFAVVDDPGFVKLGGRSPKDSYLWHERGWRVTNAEEALQLLLGASERVNDDLHLAVANEYAPWVWVREWVNIKPAEEFRCFISDRRVLGISQYWHDSTFPIRIVARAKELKRVITTFLDYEVCPHLHIGEAVVDIVVQEGDGRWKTTLLEINPFDPFLTDPCLALWPELSQLHGRLLYRDGERIRRA